MRSLEISSVGFKTLNPCLPLFLLWALYPNPESTRVILKGTEPFTGKEGCGGNRTVIRSPEISGVGFKP